MEKTISQKEQLNKTNVMMVNTTITVTTIEEAGRQKTTQRKPNSANKHRPPSIKSSSTRMRLRRSS